MSRRRTLALVLGCLAVATTGCVGIPDEGPVVETQSQVDAAEELGYFNDPRPPIPGESPTDIVKHFLDAQAAIPIQTNTAELFLTEDFAATWRPQRRTITYAAASLPQGSNQIAVELDGANRIDARGRWRGPLPETAQELTFTMEREEGEWRIADAPDALVVPESWFGQAFRRVNLYYFDPSTRILVPEPVYVPRGDQLATALVSGLLQGPFGLSSQVERSFFPPGLSVDLSVSVTDDGIAEIPLTGDAAVPTQQDAALMVAQLARTLSQDSSLEEFRVTVDGEPVALSGGVTTFPIDQGDVYDPSALQSTSLLFGLRDGRLVVGPPDVLSTADGPMGADALGIRSVGVSLDGARVAGVTLAGDRVLVTDVREPEAAVTAVDEGTDFLKPAWDFAGRIWLVDRTASGARLSVVRKGTARPVRVPGVTGEAVSDLLVSRDGSRLVAVLDGGNRDRVVVSRIRYDARGRVRSGTRADVIGWDDLTRVAVTDIAWSSPTSIAVLHRLGGPLSQIRTMLVDGAPAGVSGIATTLQQRPRAVLSTPRATDPVYAVTRGGLVDVMAGSRIVVADPEISFLTYVG